MKSYSALNTNFHCGSRCLTIAFLLALTCAGIAAADNAPVLTNSSPATNQAIASAQRAPELKVADRLLLAIPKAGFGKEYLFTASLIPQGQAATSTGLAGKIVKFELFPDGVDMYESTLGLIVTEDL